MSKIVSNKLNILGSCVVAGALVFGTLAVGCVAETEDTEETAAAEASITISDRDGVLEVIEGSPEELLKGIETIPGFVADGETATDPAVLWEANEFEFSADDESKIVVARSETSLSNDTFTVTRSSNFDTIEIEGEDRYISISLAGVEDSTSRARFVGKAAADAFGARTQIADGKAANPYLFGIVALLFIDQWDCRHNGRAACSQAAEQHCNGRLKQYKHMCAGGYDLQGHFQVGDNCSYECYPPAESPICHCGDGFCQPSTCGESYYSCPQDCPAY